MFALAGRGGVALATPEDGADGPPEEPALFSIEVHVAACEPGYAAADFFADCHGRGAPNVTVTLESPDGAVRASSITEVTAEDTPGIAVFGELPPGEYVITIDIPGDAADFESSCSADNGATAVPLAPEDTNQSTATFAAGQAGVCDWYAIPFDLRGSGESAVTPTPTPAATGDGADGEPVTALPRTGTGTGTGTFAAPHDFRWTLTGALLGLACVAPLWRVRCVQSARRLARSGDPVCTVRRTLE